ncbi:adenosylcobinamide-GDP ribazoletransferase [Paenibacillus sp. MBLB4367]|uniref:adenosylcobinamide-GDP ribazoletransferase n=1 Tax=Paenibacillus sp. MBLB4367 TaxID=3384767 RepID=UPI003907FD19
MRAAARIKQWLHAAIAAFQLLTRLPLPIAIDYTDAVFRRSVVFYPFVGAVLGLLLAAAGTGLPYALPAFPAAVLLLGMWIYATGALHLDGLMDTADGLFSNRSREQMLEIMKDSRVGAMGVVAGVFVLLLKLSLLAALLDGDWRQAAPYICCVPLWSRAFLVVSIRCWPYARQGSGMGSYYRGVGTRHTVAALLVAAVLTFVFSIAAQSMDTAASTWTAAAAAAGLVTLGFALVSFAFGTLLNGRMSAKLGGLTGDTYGAVNELVETGLLLVLVVCLRQGFGI